MDMRAQWDQHRETRLMTAFILALIFGGRVKEVDQEDPIEPIDLSGLDDGSLKLVVEQGRLQLDRQQDTFRHVTDRAQVLLTVSLVAIGFVAGTFSHVDSGNGGREITSLAFWALGTLVILLGVATAASVITVAADFNAIDTRRTSQLVPPILPKLAVEYVKAVRLGESTVAARLTVFRQATRFICWGAIAAACAFAISV